MAHRVVLASSKCCVDSCQHGNPANLHTTDAVALGSTKSPPSAPMGKKKLDRHPVHGCDRFGLSHLTREVISSPASKAAQRRPLHAVVGRRCFYPGVITASKVATTSNVNPREPRPSLHPKVHGSQDLSYGNPAPPSAGDLHRMMQRSPPAAISSPSQSDSAH